MVLQRHAGGVWLAHVVYLIRYIHHTSRAYPLTTVHYVRQVLSGHGINTQLRTNTCRRAAISRYQRFAAEEKAGTPLLQPGLFFCFPSSFPLVALTSSRFCPYGGLPHVGALAGWPHGPGPVPNVGRRHVEDEVFKYHILDNRNSAAR